MKIIRYFERKVGGGKVVGELEGLRFLAIFPVVLTHFIERWQRNIDESSLSTIQKAIITYIRSGGDGVFLFFSISGFILTLPFAIRVINNDPSPYGNLKKYFLRRLTRLEPPYILIMLFIGITVWMLGKLGGLDVIKYFFAALTYSTNFFFQEYNPLNPVIWSLEVEIQFYILAPFLATFFFRIRNNIARNSLIVGVILTMIIIQNNTGMIDGDSFFRPTILGQLQYFLVGILMVSLYLNKQLQPDKLKWLWSIIGIGSFFIFISFLWVEGVGNSILFVSFLILLFVGAFKSGIFNRFLKLPWIMAIGGMCYTIYLVHLPIAQGSMDLMVKFRSYFANDYWWLLAYGIVFFGILLIVVPVFFLLVEKPCMDHSWPKQLSAFLKRIFKPGSRKVISNNEII